MKYIKKLIGILLHYANRDIPYFSKNEFYEIKKNLLLKYGVMIGTEIQHIKSKCYSCNGTGVFHSFYKLPETCFKCGGSGVYKEFWTVLYKYKIDKWEFFIPYKRMDHYEPLFDGKIYPIIEGYINHETPKNRIGRECALWLLLIYNRKSFFNELGRIGFPDTRKTPLIIISNLLFRIKHFRFNKIIRTRRKLENVIYTDIDTDYDEIPF